MSNLIGKTLNHRYRVDESLGRGGMADVYKVWDEERAVYLAMKVLRQDLAQDPIFLRRFQREAKALAGLQHPHIVRFYGLERDDLLAFLLMEYVDGVTLQAEILRSNGNPLPTNRIIEILEAVTSALHYAHHQGLVHCDIKPGNILIDRKGQIYLTDFGIARGMDAATSTMVGIGTPAYMAPELIQGQDPTPQTDIYALGIVLYEMLTGGERPFTGERASITGTTAEKVRWEQINSEPIAVNTFNKAISPELSSLVMRCLEKKPTNRFKNIAEFTSALNIISLPQKNEKQTDKPLPEQEKKDIDSEQNQVKDKKPGKNQIWKYVLILGIILSVVGVFLFSKPERFTRNDDGDTAIEVIQPTEEKNFSLAAINATNLNRLDLYKKIGYGQIFDVIYAPDGGSILVGTEGGVYLLDSLSLEVTQQFQVEGLGSLGTSLDITSQGDNVAFSLSNGSILFLDPKSLKLISDLKIPNTEINKIKFSNSGNEIAFSTADFRVNLWDLKANASIHELSGFGDAISDISYSMDDKMIATSSYDGNVIVWDIDTYQQIKTFYDLQYGAVAVKFSPDNSFLAMSENMGKVFVVETLGWQMVSEIETEHQGSVTDMEFSHDNQRLATCSIREDIRIWNIRTGEMEVLIERHESYVYSVSFSVDDQTIASGSLDGTVRTWDAKSGEQRRERPGFMDFSQFIYVPRSGGKVYTSFGDGNLGVWSLDTFKNTLNLEYPRFFMNAVAFSSDGEMIAFEVGDYVLTGSMEQDFIYTAIEGFDSAIYAVAISPDKKTVAAGGYDQSIKIIDLETETIIQEFSVWDEPVEYLFFTPDGDQLFIGYDSALLQVDWVNFDTEPAMRLIELDAHVTDIQKNRAGDKLIISFADGDFGDYDFSTFTYENYDLPLQTPILKFTFNSDESILAVTREEGVIQFWDFENKSLISDMTINNGDYYSIDDIAFSEDSKYFFVVGSDSILRIYALVN